MGVGGRGNINLLNHSRDLDQIGKEIPYTAAKVIGYVVGVA